MIDVQDILNLHKRSIEDFGGSHGIRDLGLLESAIARPFQTFGGEDLYPSAYEKAAALAESLIINYPFVDGNKRTGVLALAAFLKENHLSLTAASDLLYQFVISISTGEKSFDKMLNG